MRNRIQTAIALLFLSLISLTQVRAQVVDTSTPVSSGGLPTTGGTLTGNLLFNPTGTYTIGTSTAAGAPIAIYAGTGISSGGYVTAGQTRIYSDSGQGIIRFVDASTETTFNRFGLGPLTSAFPAIKRNGAAINFRLGDDSADAAITSGAITSSGTITATTGTNAVPAFTFAGFTTTGFYLGASHELSLTLNTTAVTHNTATEFRLKSSNFLSWSSGNPATTAADTFISRKATASIQLGVDVNGSPVTQTIKAHDGITGSNVKGAGFIFESGAGTGSAVTDPPVINRVVTKASGTTAQTYANNFVACPTKILSNSSGSAQAIATITTTSSTAGGLFWQFTVTASNGTAVDADTEDINISWNNNAGTVAATAGSALGAVQSNGSGTLAGTPTVTVATNVVTLKLTPTWTVITPTTVTGFYSFLINSSDTLVCQ